MPDNPNAITRLRLENFTAFRELHMRFSPGLNVLIGENGTGKTHVLKVLYAAAAAWVQRDMLFETKLVRVFAPEPARASRLARDGDGEPLLAEVSARGRSAHFSLVAGHGPRGVEEMPIDTAPAPAVYIPPRDMLAQAQGVRRLYDTREVDMEEVYVDVVDAATAELLRPGLVAEATRSLMTDVEVVIGGRVRAVNQRFYLERTGDLLLEFPLVSEGWRRLALVWRLLANGQLAPGALLFWDEPETNLNPKLIGVVVEVLLELARMGVQVFIATHSYVVLEEIGLRLGPEDRVLFHALYRDEPSGDVRCSTTDNPAEIDPNAILDTFGDLYNRTVERALGERR